MEGWTPIMYWVHHTLISKKILTNLMKLIVVCQWFIDKCLY